MADETEGSIEIAARPEEVLAVITDYEAYPEWVTGIKSAQVLAKDARGRATEVAFEVNQAGVGASYTLVYRYAARKGGLSWTSKDESGVVKAIRGEYVLERSGAGTKVTYRTAIDLAIPMIGFMKRQAEKIITSTALDGLKKRVEDGV